MTLQPMNPDIEKNAASKADISIRMPQSPDNRHAHGERHEWYVKPEGREPTRRAARRETPRKRGKSASGAESTRGMQANAHLTIGSIRLLAREDERGRKEDGGGRRSRTEAAE